MLIFLETLAMEYRPLVEAEAMDALLQQLAAGDREALAQLYHRARTAVYALALSYLKNSADAEDVTQDTFVRVWENAPGYRPEGKPMAWLLTVCRNLSLMKLRERGKAVDLAQEAWDAMPALPEGLTPEDRAALHAALTTLGEEERRIVLLHAVTGLKHRELADMLALPLATVLSKYHRAMRKLRKQMEGETAL